jgi:HSP20 family molecular chaperone IbpA
MCSVYVAPRCCTLQKPEGFVITADVPGFAKDQVHVEVHDGVLTISAEKSEEKSEDTEKGTCFLQRPRACTPSSTACDASLM